MIHRKAMNALVSTAILALAIVSAAQAEARAAAPSPPPGTTTAAQRGVLFVPLRRSRPEGTVLGIEFYRFPRLDGESKAPPVFRLNGGPGFPGLAGVLERDGFYEENIQPFTQIADLVVVGQRGIGSSRPNTACDGAPGFPLDEKVPDEKVAAAFRDASLACRSFWESKGLDLTGLNVVEAAADVRDVAKALGYDKITIWGGSFGSHWGMTVMRFHPQIVERAVLNGMEGPDHTYDMPGWVLNSLERMATAAEASPELAGRIPEGGLIAALKGVIERLDKEPVVVSVPDPEGGEPRKVRLDGESIRDSSLGYTRRASSRGGIRSWPSDVLTLHAGNYLPMAKVALRRGGRMRMPTASFFMLDCGSGISPQRLAVLEADPAAAIVGRTGFFYQSACPHWGSDLGDAFRKNFETEIPTVIVHGTWDTSTPYENALELAPFFKNSRFIPVHGGSHGALNEALEASGELFAAMQEFITSGDFSDFPEKVELPPLEWVVPKDLAKSGD